MNNEIENLLTKIINEIDKEQDMESNIEKITLLLQNGDIDENDIICIVDNRAKNKIEILNYISIKLLEKENYDIILPLLSKAYELDKYNNDTIYNLTYVLNLFNAPKVALEYLSKVPNKDKNLKILEEEILKNIKVKDVNSKENSKSNYYIAPNCDIRGGDKIIIGDGVVIQDSSWVNIAYNNPKQKYQIEINCGTNIGRRAVISAANKITIGNNVLIAPNVYISDHGHEYKNIGIPIINQGITSVTNEVIIGDSSWLGINSCIMGNVRIGKNCVIGANSVVMKDIPDYCVAVGNPAKVIKVFDVITAKWIKINNDEELQQILINRKDYLNYVIPFTNLQSIQVEVSSACNLRCPQCFNNLDGHKTGFFSKKLWNEKIRPILNQVKDIHLVGIGEPLLCKDFFYFVESSVMNNVKVHTTSNLQLVDDAMAEKIVKSGISELSFSCDGATKEVYEKIRVNGSFDKLKESLQLINKYKEKYNSSTPKLILNFGAIKSNINELPQIVYFAKDYNVDLIIAYHDIIYRKELKDESLFNCQELSDKKFIEAYEIAKKIDINIFIPGLFSAPIQYNSKQIYCAYPFGHLWVYSDGRIGPCCMDFPDRYILGDIKKSTFEEIWNQLPILKLRKELIVNPSYTCRYCVNHGKMDISDPKYFFRYK